MFRFLRKYNKLLLAVFGTGLMIMFLLPQVPTLMQRAGRFGASAGTIGPDADEISMREWQQVIIETQMLDRLGLQLPGLGSIQTPAHWYLLVREAEAAGLVGGASTTGLDQVQLANLAAATGAPPRQVLEALARFQGVQNMLALARRAPKFSDRRLRDQARRLFGTIDAQVVVLQGDATAIEDVPTGDEIDAQFAAHADVAPGDGDRGFGYRLPDRLRMEWLVVEADTVRARLEVSDRFSDLELRKWWRRHEFDPLIPTVEVGAAIPDVVREQALDELLAEELEAVARFAYDRLRSRRRGEPEEGGFVILPGDWATRRMSFTELAEALQAEFALGALTASDTGPDWLPRADLPSLAGLGTASTDRFGSEPMSLAALVAEAKEFGGGGLYPIQAGIAGPPLRGLDGSVFLFRITVADPSHAPASIDEVRDEVVRDLRRLRHYERLAASMDDLVGAARTDGLLAFAVTNGAVVQPRSRLGLLDPARLVQGSLQVSPTPIPGLGEARDAVGSVMIHASALPPGTPVNDLLLEDRFLVIAVPQGLAVVLVEILTHAPLTEDVYADLADRGVLHALLRAEEIDTDTLMQGAFGFEALAARHQFVRDVAPLDPDDGAGM